MFSSVFRLLRLRWIAKRKRFFHEILPEFILSLMNEYLETFCTFFVLSSRIKCDFRFFFFILVSSPAVLITLNFFTLRPWVAPGVQKLSCSSYNRELFMKINTECGWKAQKVQRGKVSWKIIICYTKKIEKFSFFSLFNFSFFFPSVRVVSLFSFLWLLAASSFPNFLCLFDIQWQKAFSRFIHSKEKF